MVKIWKTESDIWYVSRAKPKFNTHIKKEFMDLESWKVILRIRQKCTIQDQKLWGKEILVFGETGNRIA
jgi:hypothetical protein